MSKNRCARIVALWFLTGGLFGCSADSEPTAGTPAEPDGAAAGAGAGGAAGEPDRDAAGGANPADSGGGADAGSQEAGEDAGELDAAGEGGSCSMGERFATGVTAHSFGPGQNVGQDRFPAPILGPPRGAGCCQGSLDVVSLGNGGSVTLEFGNTAIVDGPGADFIVFENAFHPNGDVTQVFAELATVEVSADGVSFVGFPCTAIDAPYGGCAGWHSVNANADTNTIDPLDPAAAGGDPFDLADIGVASARYVRITDRPDLTGFNGVFDLDAVGIVNAECR